MSQSVLTSPTFKKAVYTAKTHTVGGRTGTARSSDGRLDVQLSTPGTTGQGTNPEQLFAAGWSACFEGALGKAAANRDVKLPGVPSIDAEIDLCLEDGAYSLQARLNVSLPGLDSELARTLIEDAHQICPYSKAIRGNVPVALNLV
ncbi:organic hydroperoxide resistance protein [Hymenobacter sp. 15J16-1T3B]|uniref:organic hydroperoxide resistance protein n=1 Tax=Hymenobacter sp. 15J16-1T3B TaxID=2886941 RepID=UPI001D105422|nr:organic hydroperoxide resistance protein [Hymenobacter sp. 15J16-1T3B]MCC3158428.1 organic hydroperoxide resistance protein [Hymenobacter sp. 15J16-1T3B]